MPPYAVAVTKRFTWRGQQEEFSNVYHYDTTLAIGDGNALADAVVALDKAAYPVSVTFVRVRVWGPTDVGAAGSETVLVKDISGGGTGSFSGGQIYKELAVVCQFYVGRNPQTGRKRFLRKYIHSGQARSMTGTVTGNDALTTAEKDAWKSWWASAKNLAVGADNLPICTPQGDHLPANAPAEVLDYFHIRQLRQ